MIYNEKLVCFCILIMKPINHTHTHTTISTIIYLYFNPFISFNNLHGFVCIMGIGGI